MLLHRFQQIRSVLHCSNNNSITHSNDHLFKVRPMLNILKKTLGKYLNVGDNLALDESSFASRSKYGRNLIFYNNTKPGGKFHFRFYLLCCCDTYAITRLRVHTRNTSDLADGYNNELSIDSTETHLLTESSAEILDENTTDKSTGEDNELNKEEMLKINMLILDMCKPFYHSGRTITMDNYYGGVLSMILLRRKGLFTRCTFCSNRAHSCKYLTMTKSDTK